MCISSFLKLNSPMSRAHIPFHLAFVACGGWGILYGWGLEDSMHCQQQRSIPIRLYQNFKSAVHQPTNPSMDGFLLNWIHSVSIFFIFSTWNPFFLKIFLLKTTTVLMKWSILKSSGRNLHINWEGYYSSHKQTLVSVSCPLWVDR